MNEFDDLDNFEGVTLIAILAGWKKYPPTKEQLDACEHLAAQIATPNGFEKEAHWLESLPEYVVDLKTASGTLRTRFFPVTDILLQATRGPVMYFGRAYMTDPKRKIASDLSFYSWVDGDLSDQIEERVKKLV